MLVDDVQQNQSTRGHWQGYLGQLKSLTPKLVDDVDILNGPFGPDHGDFSGLGVVLIRLKREADRPLHGSLSGRIIRRVPHFACTWIAHHIRSPIPV